MNAYFSCKSINLDDIILEPGWDLHPFLPPDVPFFQPRDSIRQHGLLYLPLLWPSNQGRYLCLTGGRCLATAQALSPAAKVAARVIRGDLPGIAVAGLLHAEYTLQRQLSPLELAHFLRLCQQKLPETAQQKVYSLVGIPDQPQFLARHTELLKLEDWIQYGLWQERVSENMAREMLRMEKEDRATFFGLVSRLNIGTGRQKRLLMFLRDLAGRHGLSFQQLLAEESLQSILDHQEMNIPQKGQALLQQLQRLHSPAQSQKEEQFLRWQRQLDLPRNCTIAHSQAFEQDRVSLTLQFVDPRLLEEFLGNIRKYLPRE
ncbi:MAG: hypothetical protein ACK5PS_15180 [Desulfopila sp.]